MFSTLRFCDENKEKLFHVVAIIITSFAPHNYSGLPSILLSLSDLGVGKVTICGPIGLKAILHLMSPFTNRKYPTITVIEVEEDIQDVNLESMIISIRPVWADLKVKTSPIAISTIIKPNNNMKIYESSICNVIIAPIESNFSTFPSTQGLLQWGKQNYCKLVSFVPLTVDISEASISQSMVDICKEEQFVGICITGELKYEICEFRQPQKSILIANRICKHLFPQSMQNHPKDMTEEKNENENDIHSIMVGDVIEALPYMIITIISTNNVDDESLDAVLATKKRKAEDKEFFMISYSKPNDLSFSHEIDETLSRCNEIKSISSEYEIPSPYPFDVNVTFLGTGAAKSSKYRSNSCISVSSSVSSCMRNNRRATVLLDVGESVCSQIYFSVSGDLNRYYSQLLSISLIWISHHHCDHICGFPLLLEQISHAYKSKINCSNGNHQDSNCIDIDFDTDSDNTTKNPYKKILVICPNSVYLYYEYCACIAGLEDYIELMPTNQTLYVGNTNKVNEATDGFIQRLISIPVQHCRESYAVVLETSNGLKLVYSGDCRPSPSIISAGMNCDLLIHEATFDDAMSSDAIKKFHSTTSEAVGMGMRMKCKHIILTHFSQRYMSTAQVELSNNDDQQMTKCRYSVAHDFMRFAFPTQVNNIPSITRSISKFYEEYYERRKKSS